MSAEVQSQSHRLEQGWTARLWCRTMANMSSQDKASSKLVVPEPSPKRLRTTTLARSIFFISYRADVGSNILTLAGECVFCLCELKRWGEGAPLDISTGRF